MGLCLGARIISSPPTFTEACLRPAKTCQHGVTRMTRQLSHSRDQCTRELRPGMPSPVLFPFASPPLLCRLRRLLLWIHNMPQICCPLSLWPPRPPNFRVQPGVYMIHS